MQLLLLAIIGGLSWSLVAERRLPDLTGLRWPSRWVIAGAIAAQLLAAKVHGPARVFLVDASSTAVAVWAVVLWRRQRTDRRHPFAFIAAGIWLNLIPILRYGGMPVSAAGLRRIGESSRDVTNGQFGKHVLADGTPLSLLGDVISLPPFRILCSLGDVVMAVGIVLLLAGYVPADRKRLAAMRIDPST